jgi:hypothetical protein
VLDRPFERALFHVPDQDVSGQAGRVRLVAGA